MPPPGVVGRAHVRVTGKKKKGKGKRRGSPGGAPRAGGVLPDATPA